MLQRLEGEATGAGLWLVSTLTNQPDDRFQIKAAILASQELLHTGTVTVTDSVVRFLRPGLIEEYTVGMDGVRQDFVVLERPEYRIAGLEPGEQGSNVPEWRTALQLELAVTGARVERSADGVHLVLEKSGRKIAYHRMLVTDAAGTELRARMEILDKAETGKPNSPMSLAVVVDDTDAQYPIRIDPTFSDANWVSMGGIQGENDAGVWALVASGSQLYAGGAFTMAGGKVSANVARAYLERPVLSQVRSDGEFTLSWPTFYEAFVLQQNADTANPSTWSNAGHPVISEGSTNRVTVPLMSDNQFFRLKGD